MRFRPALAAVTLALALGAGGLSTPVAAQATTLHSTTLPATQKSASYPYADANPTKVDPWGAGIRQCTSFASWWLTSHGVKIDHGSGIHGPKGTAQLRNAGHWDVAARQAGFAVSSKPVVGAIAEWHANERSSWSIPHGYSYVLAGSDGHVAVVRKVFSDGTALLQDYNGAVPLGGHTFRGKAPRYLLIHA